MGFPGHKHIPADMFMPLTLTRLRPPCKAFSKLLLPAAMLPGDGSHVAFYDLERASPEELPPPGRIAAGNEDLEGGFLFAQVS